MTKMQEVDPQVGQEYLEPLESTPPEWDSMPDDQVVAKPEEHVSADFDRCHLSLQLESSDGQVAAWELNDDWAKMVVTVCSHIEEEEGFFLDDMPTLGGTPVSDLKADDGAIVWYTLTHRSRDAQLHFVLLGGDGSEPPVCAIVVEEDGLERGAYVPLPDLLGMVVSYIAWGVSRRQCQVCGTKSPITDDSFLKGTEDTLCIWVCPCCTALHDRGGPISSDAGHIVRTRALGST